VASLRRASVCCCSPTSSGSPDSTKSALIAESLGSPETTHLAIKEHLVRQIVDRLRLALPSPGTYRLVVGPRATWIEPGIVAALEDEGFRLLVDADIPSLSTLYTPARRYRGEDVAGVVYVVPSAIADRFIPVKNGPSVERLMHTGITARDRRELVRLNERLQHKVEKAGGLVLSNEGELEARRSGRGPRAQNRSDYRNVRKRLTDGTLASLYRDGLVVGPKLDQTLLDRQEALTQAASPAYQFDVALAR
jgi:hypothetical protein